HDHILIPALKEVGRMWQLGEAPIADEHLTSRTVHRALEMIQQDLPAPSADGPRVLAFAVSGNPHDLPIRMVCQRMELAGFQVTDLGSNMPASDLAWAVTDRPFDLLAVSATLLQHLGAAADVVRRRNTELGGKPPILFGGGVFGLVPDLHERLGGEASAATAKGAVEAAKNLLA
ncbi:MAG: cobalamin-dependent protein, partial [Planctomycetota bacterium]|nr:cobalamin-dependent protein [Planctomycetota bacterium]